MSTFPTTRPRRVRQTDWSRRLVQENHLTVHDLIWPLFVHDEANSVPIGSLPGQHRWNIEDLCIQAKRAEELGIPAIALFPSTPIERKTPDGEEAYNPDNLVCRSIQAIRSCTNNLGIIADVALDPFTTHGQG